MGVKLTLGKSEVSTCHECFALVLTWDLPTHTDWHSKTKVDFMRHEHGFKEQELPGNVLVLR